MNFGILWTQFRNFSVQLGRLVAAVWNGTIHIDEKGVVTAPNWSLPNREEK